MNKILVVGQTPPPYHGQAIMIEKMLSGDYGNIELLHIRLEFSDSMSDIGKVGLSKIIKLLQVIGKIITMRFRQGIKVLYYPPAGPNLIPIIRDVLILVSTRWLFERTIFHFHASGLTSIYPRLPKLFGWMFRKSYFYPDIAIRLSEFAPEDGKLLMAKKEFIIPNGIEDEFENYSIERDYSDERCVNILYVGIISDAKGVGVLLEALVLLKNRGSRFRASLMGKFVSEEYRQTLEVYLKEKGLDAYVTMLGFLEGKRKWEVYAHADIFCFPTFFDSETFPVVLIEAFSFALPVITTSWRGIPSIIDDGVHGYMVPIKDSKALAQKLELLIDDPLLRRKFGWNGRKKYLEYYSIEKYHQRLLEVFSTAVL